MLNKAYLPIVLFLATIAAEQLGLDITIVFVLSILTILKSSHVLGYSTEELANHYNPTIGGLLNSTFGNLAELVIGFFALQQGFVEIVKASITGSIIGNILLVFGLAVLIGGLRHKELSIKKAEAEISSTMLLITALLLLFPSIMFMFNEEVHEGDISLITALVLIVLYFSSLIFSLYTHKEWFASHKKTKPTISKLHAVLLMVITISIIVVISEGFAKKIEGISKMYGLGELFVGAIIIAIIGNVAEHLSAISFAFKNRMSLALQTTIGSSIQIAMFVAPLLVFLSYTTGTIMSLSFLPIEIIVILASVFLINEIARDSKLNWVEGLQLLGLYLIIAFLFFWY